MSELQFGLLIMFVLSLIGHVCLWLDCRAAKALATSQEYVAEFYKKDAKRWMAIRGLYGEKVGNDLERWVDNIIKLKEYGL